MPNKLLYFIKETPPVIEEQHVNVSADNETSSNGFIKYLDLSKTPLCVSILKYFYFLGDKCHVLLR